ncbi:MAG: nuclear transport factor 2 family protein [Roseiflexaceae bacterium]|nr:nuclear transport factor 2 family protein [Roseiflexus sp.]MDW8213984.1 nuclear transport factor 2 family protein [Roseiflexaceae bacterium]
MSSPALAAGYGGREQALQDFSEPGFTPGRIEVELERVIPLVDAGLVTGRSRVAVTVGGASISGVYRFTRVWRRANGEWRILATHTSVEETPA